MFSEVKEKFQKDIEGFEKMPAKERDALIQIWTLKLMFECYGELSSLSYSYKEMLKIVQGREGKK